MVRPAATCYPHVQSVYTVGLLRTVYAAQRRTRRGLPRKRNSEQKQERATHVMMPTSARKYAGPHRVAGPHMPPPTSKRPAARATPASIKYKSIRAPRPRVGSADPDTNRTTMAPTTARPTSQPDEELTGSVYSNGSTHAEARVTFVRVRVRG